MWGTWGSYENMNFHNEIFFIVIESLAFLGVPWRTLALPSAAKRRAHANALSRHPAHQHHHRLSQVLHSSSERASDSRIRGFRSHRVCRGRRGCSHQLLAVQGTFSRAFKRQICGRRHQRKRAETPSDKEVDL